MSENFQIGHPDADQLNAFMENALPAAERERTLAHLAACADCRMVVALAGGAEEETAGPAVVEEEPRGWWRVPVWQWGLPLAAVLGLVLVTVRRETPRVVGNAPVERAAGKAPVLPAGAVEGESKGEKRIPFGNDNKGNDNKGNENQKDDSKGQKRIDKGLAAQEDMPIEGQSVARLPQPAVKVPEVVGAAAAQGRAMKEMAASSAPMPAPPPPAAAAAAQPTMATRSAVVVGAGAGAGAGAAKAPVAVQAGSGQNTILTGAALAGTTDDVRPVAAVRLGPAPMAAAPKPAAVVAMHPLPSGLATVSVTTAAGAAGAVTTVALDSGSHLFVTRDGGVHWAAVEAKWTGKAVRVGLVGRVAGVPVLAQDAVAGEQFSNASVAALPQKAAGSSSITGVVTDATGAVIPGATVSVKENGGAVVRTATTDSQGRYSIAGVTPGSITLRGTAPGFVQQEVAVGVPGGTRFNQDLRLSVGSVSETVTVTNGDLQTLNAKVGDTDVARKMKKAEAAVFELVTEKGERWVSGDGVVWVKR